MYSEPNIYNTKSLDENTQSKPDTSAINDELLDMLDLKNIIYNDDKLADYVFNCVNKKFELIIKKFPKVQKTLDECHYVKNMIQYGLPKRFANVYELTTLLLLVISFTKIKSIM